MIPSYAAAFVAGLVTFLAPCTLPLVPAYITFLGGANHRAATPRRQILWTALLFILGFSLVFMIFGGLAGFFGTVLGPARLLLQRIGGIIVIVLGLSMLGVLRLPFLQRSFQARVPGLARLPAGRRSFLFGIILGSGWTPCVGPILGTILFLAASTTTVLSGISLLAVYSLGLAVPFLIVALFYSRAAHLIARVAPLSRGIEIVAGLFLLFLGYLFLTDRMTLFIARTYQLLDFINYDALYRFF